MKSQAEYWLEDIGLGQYANMFAQNRIDLDVLSDLTEANLAELGVPLGDRKETSASDGFPRRRKESERAATRGPRIGPERGGANGGKSPSCSATWSARRRCRRNSIPKMCAT